MKLSNYGLVVLLALLVMSCTEKETPGGLKYKVIKKGDGAEVAYGNFLVLNMELRDSKDSIWFSTSEEGNPVVLPVPDASMEKDEGEYGVFKVLTKGDSVSFQLTAQTIFTKTRRKPVPKNVDPKSIFTFNMGLKDVWTKEQVEEFQQKLMMKGQQEQIKTDSITINNYLIEKGLEAKSTASGLRYIVKAEGKGALAVSGNTAYVHYAGYLLDGTLFDTSLASVAKANNLSRIPPNEPYPVVVNTGSVIAGWEEMIQLMNKGMKVQVFIPSYLAYRDRGYGQSIPPNTVLMFDMELTDLK
jgi:FKBP-type peptidyl-prolyl cis-trans isomerase